MRTCLHICMLVLGMLLYACNSKASEKASNKAATGREAGTMPYSTDTGGYTVETRFPVLKGTQRIATDSNSFGFYLRNLPLFPADHAVRYFDGSVKPRENIYMAVVKQPIGTKDLHHCADAVMHLRADYLWQTKQYDAIHFNLTNGFRMDYRNWMDGNRLVVKGNATSWQKTAIVSNTEEDLWNYLQWIFMYAGTLSLSKEMKSLQTDSMQIGDVFIVGGSPGHAVIVVDMAQDITTGKKYFMLAQSYMPGQETQILLNADSPNLGPWYPLDFGDVLHTPQYWFDRTDLKRF